MSSCQQLHSRARKRHLVPAVSGGSKPRSAGCPASPILRPVTWGEPCTTRRTATSVLIRRVMQRSLKCLRSRKGHLRESDGRVLEHPRSHYAGQVGCRYWNPVPLGCLLSFSRPESYSRGIKGTPQPFRQVPASDRDRNCAGTDILAGGGVPPAVP